MKFTDGYWHTRPGIDAQYAAEAHDMAAQGGTEGQRVVVWAPTTVIARRGDTLNGALLTVALPSPMEGVVTVRIEHHRGAPWSGGFGLVGAETAGSR